MANVGRPCATCTGDRSSIERALVEGVPVSRISREHGPSVASILRHVRSHMAPVFADSFRENQAIDRTDLTLALSEVVERAELIADKAVEAGNHGLALRAGDALLRSSAVMTERLGQNFKTEAETLRDARNVLRAIRAAATADPAVALALAAQLRDQGHDEDAQQYELLASIHESRQAEMIAQLPSNAPRKASA